MLKGGQRDGGVRGGYGAVKYGVRAAGLQRLFKLTEDRDVSGGEAFPQLYCARDADVDQTHKAQVR